MSPVRQHLEDYVRSGKLMQLATLSADGSPYTCSVWYDFSFAPDVLRFISRHDRYHSVNIRTNGRVAGCIVAIELEQLGQVARGISYTGIARELPTVGINRQIEAFIARWPLSRSALDPARLANGHSPTRLYEIAVETWILFDEANFPDDPRQQIPARRAPFDLGYETQ